jgi:Tc5 transposase-like DNA-binding protein
MINIHNVIHLFNDLVNQKYPMSDSTEPSSKDYELADQLFLLFNQLLNSAELVVDHIVTFTVNDYADDTEEYKENVTDDISLKTNDMIYPYDTMCDIVEYSKTHTFASVCNRYRKIKYNMQLQRIKQYVEDEGTKYQKYQRINDFVFAEFTRAKESYLPIHDSDLRRLAIKKARDLNVNSFTASHHWLLDFKHHHHISSRKITKLVTRHHLEDRQKILKSAADFVKTVKDLIPKYSEHHIFNTDQSGFK